jgi:hypothetical protein
MLFRGGSSVMNNNCCHSYSSGKDNGKIKDAHVDVSPKRKNIAKRFYNVVKCVVPGAILILLPKCPICLAAWISVGTGFGISITAAGYLRATLIIVCVSSLFYFVVSRLKIKRWRHH